MLCGIQIVYSMERGSIANPILNMLQVDLGSFVIIWTILDASINNYLYYNI